jgi:hypothetical protein
MSKSIRISDELLRLAKEEAERFHRSPPQQIEHWAQIGRVMEPSLSYNINAAIQTWGSKTDVDELIAGLNSEKTIQRTRQIIQNTSGKIIEGNGS